MRITGLHKAGVAARDNLRLGGYSSGDSEGVEKDIAAMEALFPILAEKRKAKGSALSCGQQKRLAIGRGLMAKPKILIHDELSVGLTPTIVPEARSIIFSVRGLFGASPLFAEQNTSLALAVADRACGMRNGRIGAARAITALRGLERVWETYPGGRERRPRSPRGAARSAS